MCPPFNDQTWSINCLYIAYFEIEIFNEMHVQLVVLSQIMKSNIRFINWIHNFLWMDTKVNFT